MENIKNPGPLRKLLSKYNTPLVWLACGVMFLAQADMIYKMTTGKNQKLNKSERDEQIQKEKEDVAQMMNNVKEKFNEIKNFFGVNGTNNP